MHMLSMHRDHQQAVTSVKLLRTEIARKVLADATMPVAVSASKDCDVKVWDICSGRGLTVGSAVTSGRMPCPVLDLAATTSTEEKEPLLFAAMQDGAVHVLTIESGSLEPRHEPIIRALATARNSPPCLPGKDQDAATMQNGLVSPRQLGCH